MQLDLKKGKYVVAVSGGVDSVVLLNILAKHKPKLDLVVAHFDHGIRQNSSEDRIFVEDLAKKYQLPFVSETAKLGPNASEELSRNKRYEFLWNAVKKTKAVGLITAHHQDDLIESAIINMVRGTGRRGLSSIISPKVKRPLLNYTKKQIIEYANKNNLSWHEDETNKDKKYLRNYIRKNVTPKLKSADRTKILAIINNQAKLNKTIDSELSALIDGAYEKDKLPRLWFNTLDSKTANEVLAFWLRQNGLSSYDNQTINRLSISLKTSKQGKQINALSGYLILITKEYLALKAPER